MGVRNGTATLENNLAFSQKLHMQLSYDPVITLGVYLREMKTYVYPKSTPNWKQPTFIQQVTCKHTVVWNATQK